jgi:integrase
VVNFHLPPAGQISVAVDISEIFTRLPSYRDRALIAFYVSTGARASELLSATQDGVDPGRS